MANIPDIEDLDFERSVWIDKYSEVNPERIERIQKDILFSELVADFYGKTGSEISCPFHGRDSRPSFYVYPPSRGNSGWCFGCPSGSQFYDQINFVSKLLGLSWIQAIVKIEQYYNLPPIADKTIDPEEEEIVSLTMEDLAESYVRKARKDVQDSKDLELAQDYISIYFQANELDAASKDKMIGKTEAEELNIQAVHILAKVLGADVVERIAQNKVYA